MTNLCGLLLKATKNSFYFLLSKKGSIYCRYSVQYSQIKFFSSKNNETPSIDSKSGKGSRSAEWDNIPNRNVFMPSVPSEVCLQVIQSGCHGYYKSLFLFTSTNRYLINCPENTCRLVTNSVNQIGKLNNVFVTQNTWSNIGGLPGFGVTKRAAARKRQFDARPEIFFHGPPGMDAIFKATKCMYDGEPPVVLIERPYTLGKYEDECLFMNYVPLFGRFKKVPECDKNEDSIVDGSNVAEKMIREVSVGYIFTLKSLPGHLLVDKCMKAGVPKGPLLRELVEGRDVTLPDGRTIRSADVTTEPCRTPSFAVVDVSDEYFLDSLLNCDNFDNFFDATDENPIVKLDLLVHLTTDAVFSLPAYQNWMKKFGSRTRHLVLNTLSPLLPHNEGMFRLQAQLNYINSDLFPLLDSHKYAKPTADLDRQIVFAEPLLKYHFRPHKAFERGERIEEIEHYVQTLKDDENFVSTFAEHVEELKNSSESLEPVEKYPELIFCGTGSACPTKVRNTTGILLNINDHHSILFDCGEGTYSQLFEMYGPNEIDKILCNIKLIFISHMHQDHHMGLFTVMMKRKEAFEKLDLNFEQVYIIGAPDLFHIQREYSQNVEDILPFARPIKTDRKYRLDARTQLQEIISRLNLKSLTVFPVNHPKMARGISVRLSNGKKIVYSGDTRPCTDLIDIGVNADLLVHEATFENDLIQEAVKKNHCTIVQAINVSEQMNAKRTVLTHFSARYPRMPLIDDANLNDKVGVAFDFLKVNLSNFYILPKLIQVMKAAFAKHSLVPEYQNEKRALKRKREEFIAFREKREMEKKMKMNDNE